MNMILGLMISDSLLTREHAARLAKESARLKMDIPTCLITRNIFTEIELAHYLAVKYDLKFVDPENLPIDPAVLNTLPPALVRWGEILPIEIRGEKSLAVALSNPSNVYPMCSIQSETGYNFVSIFVAPIFQLRKAIAMRYGDEKSRRLN